MKRSLFAVLLATALAVLPGLAQAQPAHVSVNVHLRAGPSTEYPIIAVLPAGLQISVQACLGGYTWCDVLAGGYRGWVYAPYIEYPYQGRVVPLPSYGPQIGIAIVGFVLLDYWANHYRDRAFYRDRDRWARRAPPPPRPRPPPPRVRPREPQRPAPRVTPGVQHRPAPRRVPEVRRQPPQRAPQVQPPHARPPQAPQRRPDGSGQPGRRDRRDG